VAGAGGGDAAGAAVAGGGAGAAAGAGAALIGRIMPHPIRNGGALPCIERANVCGTSGARSGK